MSAGLLPTFGRVYEGITFLLICVHKLWVFKICSISKGYLKATCFLYPNKKMIHKDSD